MPSGEHRHSSGFQPTRLIGIAVDPMRNPLLERFDYRRGRRQIHIGDPHRDHVATGPAVPLEAVAMATIELRRDEGIHGDDLRRWLSTCRLPR